MPDQRPPTVGEKWRSIADPNYIVVILIYDEMEGLVYFSGIGREVAQIGEFAAEFQRVPPDYPEVKTGLWVQFADINGSLSQEYGPYSTLRVTETTILADGVEIAWLHPQAEMPILVLYEVLLSSRAWRRYTVVCK